MKLLLIFGILCVLCVLFPVVRCIMLNPHFASYYGAKDLYHYIKYKLKNNSPVGQLISYTGLFGMGKTLSMVHDTIKWYDTYNGKQWFDIKKGKWVTNQCVILSNVDINRPYIKLESLQQIVDYAHKFYDEAKENDCHYLIMALIDEASVMLNSRSFKTNFDPLFLNTLLTSRHYNMSILTTSQRFSLQDALLRQVTQQVFDCQKIWRCQVMRLYDAYELENCTNPLLIKPMKTRVWFVRDKDYNNYNTLECVKNLEHAFVSGDMISEDEILRLQQSSIDTDNENIMHYSKKASKRKHFKKGR